MGVPVNTAVSPPKWMAHIDFVHGIKPAGIFGKPQYREEFPYRIAYLERLEKFEDEIKADLQRLSDKYPATEAHPNGQPLVLLCWCDVHKGEWCHRRMFADWLADRDIVVPEADLLTKAKPARASKPTAPRGTPGYYNAKDDERFFFNHEPLF
jgi:hypothetical protein